MEDKKNKIFNELNHEPLVWGVPFASLMLILSSLVLSTTIFMRMFKVWNAIIFAFSLNFVLYIVLLRYTRIDKIELYGRFQRAIKKNIDSLNKSTQGLIIK